MTDLTIEQVLALAPDAAAAKASTALASRHRWASLGAAGRAVWGQCAGSGGSPYEVGVDLNGPAFRCSCPSRKLPCKHGLALLMLACAEDLPEGGPPAWLNEWLEQRTRRELARAGEGGPAVAPTGEALARREAEQERRSATRAARVTAGVEELELWLSDLIEEGIAMTPSAPLTFWDLPAARLVDAQAPGLARRVAALSAIAHSAGDWPRRLLEQLGLLHLLVSGHHRLADLPSGLADEVRAQIGWTQSAEEVAAGGGIRDRWVVVGQRSLQEERLRTTRTWLWGRESGRSGLHLAFAAAGQAPEVPFVLGTSVDATLGFYSGETQRCLPVAIHGPAGAVPEIPAGVPVATALTAYGAAVARNPWLPSLALRLSSVVPIRRQASWVVRDISGDALPLRAAPGSLWRLMAVSGGAPLMMAGEWDGNSLIPLSAWSSTRLVGLM